MVHSLKAWAAWMVLFLCACSAAGPRLPAERLVQDVRVIRPAGGQLVELTREEYRAGMQMLFGRGPLPGASRAGSPRFILTSADPWQLRKAAGYLQFCEQVGRGRGDCWEVLTPEGGLDESGARDVALRFAFAEAIQEAVSAVGSMTPEQVRAILGVALVGTIVAVLSPDPVTKYLVIVTGANLIAFLGVDLFNNVVKGYQRMAEDLALARDFAQARAAGERYGRRLGPSVARIVLMVATYGVAKFAGLFPGSATSLPGGSRAAALAEAQGFRVPAAEGARSIAVAADGSVTIAMGSTAAMTAAPTPGAGRTVWEDLNQLAKAGKAMDREGLTRAGRALEKHGGWHGSLFSKATGNVAAKNRQGQQILEEILNHPATKSAPNRFGGRDYLDPTGRGARFNEDGSFRGFLEPPTP